MEKEIEELKKRVEELEKRPHYMPMYPPIYAHPATNYPAVHYHGMQPCYNNPCVWS